MNAVPVTGEPFLLTLSGGRDAHRLSRQSDLEIISGTTAALNSMFG